MDSPATRLIHTWALDAAAQAAALAQLDPSWGSETHPVADGHLVLSGTGMYVNRVLGAGLATEVSTADIDFVVSRSKALGVEPGFEVSPETLPSTIALLTSNGFVRDLTSDITAFTRSLDATAIDAPEDLTMQQVRSTDDLALWQEVSAAGWGHVDEAARSIANAFARAAHVTDADGMVIAVGATNSVPRGCASVTMRDGLATLGGMSTLPAFRRTGVQTALIKHRLNFAAERGCDLAAATGSTGGDSERNLIRLGFEPLTTIERWHVRADS